MLKKLSYSYREAVSYILEISEILTMQITSRQVFSSVCVYFDVICLRVYFT